MDEDGSTKDDVKLPEGEIGDKIERMFREEEKDCSKWKSYYVTILNSASNHTLQTSLSSPPWVSSAAWMSRRLPRANKRLNRVHGSCDCPVSFSVLQNGLAVFAHVSGRIRHMVTLRHNLLQYKLGYVSQWR